MKRLTIIFAVALVVGCTVGPDYEQPTAQTLSMPAGYATTQPATQPGPLVFPDTAWWQRMNDPTLDRLVAQATVANLDVEVALARLREARALRRASRAGYLPQLSAGADYRRTRLSENGAGIGQAAVNLQAIELEQDLYQVGFDASWELDVFGGIRRSVQAADAREAATLEAARDVLLSVQAEVARNYAELRGAQSRLSVARRNINIQEDSLDLVKRKRSAGLVPEVDVAQAQTLLETTRAGLPPLRAATRAAAYRLAVLTAVPPAAMAPSLLDDADMPSLPALASLDLPAELLRRRPDLRRAERQLAAASADVGVATAELYPKFRLLGSLGLESVEAGDLFDTGSRVWSIGPGVTVPLLTGGRLRAVVDAEQAQLDAALATYQQAVLLALEDVDASLVRRLEAENEVEQLTRARDAAVRAVGLATILYDRGLRDFQVVLDAQSSLANVDDRLATAEARVVIEAIALFKSLGGGWDTPDAAKRMAAAP